MAEIGTAYVRIVPSADGIKANTEKIIDPAMDNAGNVGGATLGSKLIGAFKKYVGPAVMAMAVKESLFAGGALQQSIGGVETMFKDNANVIREYANNAFETCGLSANAYMESVTGFSASLLQSLGGDTNKATSYAQMAMVDMSDNANKFGTDMGMIEQTYQGFAKQNYTMLDNLKLGYGGTKTEMERLIADANRVKEANGEMANLSIDSFADVVEAIHTIQTEMGVTGTTAKEASTTLFGSFNAMKAAAQNVLGNLALGESIIPSLQALGQTTSTFLFGNLIPMFGNIVGQVATLIMTQGPQLVTSGMQMLSNLSQGLVQGIPEFVNKGLDMLLQFSQNILANMPLIIQSGYETLSNFVQGVMNSLPSLIEKGPTIISNFANSISTAMPLIIMNGVKLIGQLIKGIISAIPTLVANIPKIVKAIVDVIIAFDWLSLGSKIIKFFTNGIKSMLGITAESGKSVFEAVWNAIKSLPGKLKELAHNAISKIASTFKGGVSSVGEAASNIVSTVKGKFTGLPDKVWGLIKSIPSKLTSAFKFTIPHIALPHISVSGKLSLKPPSVPKIGISWYAKGGLFNGAQIAGLGEAGPEYALPLNKRSLMPLAVNLNELRNEDGMSSKLDTVIQILKMLLDAGVYIDGDKLVGAILPSVDRQLGGAI